MRAPLVLVAAKRSAYGRYVEDEGDPRVRELLDKRDPSVAHWMPAHREHVATLKTVLAALEALGVRASLLRRPHAAFETAGAELVVAVGGDGTLLAASHNLDDVPILGVNSSPKHSVGFFCAAHRGNVRAMLAHALEGTLPRIKLNRMSVAVNGRVRSRRVLNEALFSHAVPAATSRYLIGVGRVREEQRSSGIWVGPAAGSTAAQRSAGGRVLPLRSKKLQLVVREPYIPDDEHYRLLKVIVNESQTVRVQSQMHDACMFLDGPYKRINVNLGDEVSFAASREPLTVLGLVGRGRSAEV